jgi:hypothetical protein
VDEIYEVHAMNKLFIYKSAPGVWRYSFKKSKVELYPQPGFFNSFEEARQHVWDRLKKESMQNIPGMPFTPPANRNMGSYINGKWVKHN